MALFGPISADVRQDTLWLTLESGSGETTRMGVTSEHPLFVAGEGCTSARELAPGDALAGQSYVDKILVLNTAKGGVATAWMLYEMVSRGLAPMGLLLNSANTILAQGAALAEMPLADRFEDGDVTQFVQTGDTIRVDPETGQVTIL